MSASFKFPSGALFFCWSGLLFGATQPHGDKHSLEWLRKTDRENGSVVHWSSRFQKFLYKNVPSIKVSLGITRLLVE